MPAPKTNDLDRTIDIDKTVGAKRVRFLWPSTESKPTIFRFFILAGGGPDAALFVDDWVGLRHVVVDWPSGKWEAKWKWHDHLATEQQDAERQQ